MAIIQQNFPPKPGEIVNVNFNDNSVFSGTIESIAKLGVLQVTHTPSSESGAILAGIMRKTILNLSSSAMTGSSHGIGGYDYLEILGDNNSAQNFVHEAKVKQTGSGTHTKTIFYKTAKDTISGTHTYAIGLDCTDVDFGTINYPVYNPVTFGIFYNLGAISVGQVSYGASGAYTLSATDNGKTITFAAGTAVTVTCPATLNNFHCRVIQGDSNQVTFSAGASAAVVNANSHTKTRATYSVVTLTTTSQGLFVLAGDTAA